MDDTIPDTGVDLPEVSQVGFVVEDLDDGMDRFGSLLGIGPWEVYRFEPPRLTETTFRGEEREFSMALAITDLAGTMIELIEPLAGESLYTEHLDEHGEGLHHVACFSFDDTEGAVESFEEAGIDVVQSGRFAGAPFWYLDTREAMNGVLFETATGLETMPDPDRTYPE